VTDVLTRPRVQPARGGTATAVGSVWVQGAFAATWAFVVGAAALVLISLFVWAADSSSVAGATGAMRFGAQLWLLAQRTPLEASGGSLAIPPLALTFGAVVVLAHASALVARSTRSHTRGDVGTVVLSVTGPYAVLAAAVAALARSAALRPSIGAAFVCAVVVGGLASTLGALRGSGLAQELWRDVPVTVRTAADAAGRAGLVLLVAAAGLVAVSLLSHAGQVGSLITAYHGGPGQFAMVALSIAYLPNAVIFAMSYLLGSGFAVGTGTSVTLAGSHLGAVPAFPLIAAVPAGPAPWPVLAWCAAGVAAAGAAAGWRIARRSGSIGGSARADRLGRWEQVRAAFTAAAGLGVVSAVIGAFAGGPGGPGRLSAVGPSPWRLGLMVTGEVAVVSALMVLLCAWLGAVRARR
jgi:Family of unknown function (DUF6350)